MQNFPVTREWDEADWLDPLLYFSLHILPSYDPDADMILKSNHYVEVILSSIPNSSGNLDDVFLRIIICFCFVGLSAWNVWLNSFWSQKYIICSCCAKGKMAVVLFINPQYYVTSYFPHHYYVICIPACPDFCRSARRMDGHVDCEQTCWLCWLATSDTFYIHSWLHIQPYSFLIITLKLTLHCRYFQRLNNRFFFSIKHFNYVVCALKGVKNFISTPSEARGCYTNTWVTDWFIH